MLQYYIYTYIYNIYIYACAFMYVSACVYMHEYARVCVCAFANWFHYN